MQHISSTSGSGGLWAHTGRSEANPATNCFPTAELDQESITPDPAPRLTTQASDLEAAAD
jgi:hypothetical protein